MLYEQGCSPFNFWRMPWHDCINLLNECLVDGKDLICICQGPLDRILGLFHGALPHHNLARTAYFCLLGLMGSSYYVQSLEPTHEVVPSPHRLLLDRFVRLRINLEHQLRQSALVVDAVHREEFSFLFYDCVVKE